MDPLRHYHRKLNWVCAVRNCYSSQLVPSKPHTEYYAIAISLSSVCWLILSFRPPRFLGFLSDFFFLLPLALAHSFALSVSPLVCLLGWVSASFPFRIIPLCSFLAFLRFPSRLDQALDLLVLARSSITALTPPTYQPCRLQGVLPTCVVGYFFLRWASRLDAFSVYPIRTSLLCYAFGKTTVAPEVRPFRSSRTRNSSSHVSFAHDG